MPTLTRHGSNRSFHLAALLFGSAIWAGNPAAAVLTWQNPATGDWFDGINWDAAGNIPQAGDTARIVNGGIAEATSGVNTSNLVVGSTATTDAASGSLQVTTGNMTLDGTLQVGDTLGNATTSTTATGAIDVAGTISGVSGSLLVGSNQGLDSTAHGSIVSDSYSGTHGLVAIGRDDAGGSGNGSLVVNNTLDLGPKVTFFEVGRTFANGLVAHGELRAASGDVLTGTTFIGLHAGSATAAGDVTAFVDLGAGSLSSDQNGALFVGRMTDGLSGSAAGELYANGLSGFGTQSVGTADSNTSGTVTGTLVVGTDGIAGESLTIGTTNGAADTTGSVQVLGGDVVLSTHLNLGNNAGNSGATADGSLRVHNGNLQIGTTLSMGVVSGSDAANQAVATLELTNGELAARLVSVALASGAGSSDAAMTLENVTGHIQTLQVGASFDAQGKANGRVELLGSIIDVEEFVALGQGFNGTGNGILHLVDSRLNVGVAPGAGPFFGDMFVATGVGGRAEVTLERSLIDLSDGLFLDSGTQLRIALGGGLRVAEYGAIDAATALLGGNLEIAFDFTPTLNDMVFDLVVSGLPDGISSDFASVSILGLDAAYSAMTGVEIANIGGTDVEVYRLRVSRNGVPEPATLLLILLALSTMLAVASKRKRQSAAPDTGSL